jgi:WD40 repeat protein/predicted Ser/Thr protein kinase
VRVFDRWNEVERLFNAALEHNSAHRTEFLSNECTDPDVLAEVLSLLDAHEKGTSAFDRPPDKLAADLIAAIDEQQDSLIGSSFDHYEIIGLLGKGGMGRVYLAHDSRLMRKVALKVLPSSQVRSMDGLRRFAQEARLASALNHPNIITVYDYGEAFSSYFIATEYVEGPTLRALIEQRPTLEKALDISIQIASALSVAHRSGIIHRDIKPENIIVRADGLAKVLDFGLAKSSSGRGSTNALLETPESIPGAIIGTFHYMSPEQARGQELDARTDIFSFGIVLYELLAGRRPLDRATLPDLLDALVRKDAPLLSTFVPDIPAEVETIAASTLARDRDDRYQSFDAVLADLSSVKKRLDVGEQLVPASRKATSAAGISEAEDGPDKGGTSGQAQTGAGLETAAAAGNSITAGVLTGFRRLRYYMMVGFLFIGAASYQALTNRWPFERKTPSRHQLLPDEEKLTRQSEPKVLATRPITKDKTDRITAVAASTDGKYFAYAQQNEISISRIPTAGQRTEEPTEPVRTTVPCKDCTGLTFSSDGEGFYLYWVAPSAQQKTRNVYRIPVHDEGVPEPIGVPKLIRDDVGKSISFSPDGKQFVFVQNARKSKRSQLVIYNFDGPDERVLNELKDHNDLWLYPAWSPDGKVVACGVMNKNKPDGSIYIVPVDDMSKDHPIGKTWATVSNLAWMPGGDYIIANAAKDGDYAPGLWSISYPGGNETKLSSDLDGYSGASFVPGSGTVVSVRKILNAHLYVAKDKSDAPPALIDLGSSAYGKTGLCRAPDGKIIYNAGPVDRKLLYQVDPASPTQRSERPLTDGASDSSPSVNLDNRSASETSPSVTPDNKYIVFASDRGGKLAVWRADRDGGHPTRLTDDGMKPTCLLENNWVVYQRSSGDGIRLWRVPIDGGMAAELLPDQDGNAENPAVSPDGKSIAFLLTAKTAGARPQIAIIDNGKLLPARYQVADRVRQPIMRWRDAETLVYIDEFAKDEVWQQHLRKGRDGADKGTPARPTRYKLPGVKFKVIFNFDLSTDGRMVLSAGGTSSDTVYELTLTSQF